MGRKAVMKFLKENEGKFVSGESISEHIGITRSAIWKDMSALRSEGYEIEAKSGLGYRLVSRPDALTNEEIENHLTTEKIGHPLICLDSVDSTNTYAKKIAAECAADGTVVVANCQTKGRGRMERPFQSPPDKGIYLSVILKPQLPPMRMMPVTAMGAVAVCNAIERVCGVRPQIKWTNDIVMNGKKICGILTEMALESESGRLQYVVMGIGINANHGQGDFEEKVAEIASSLLLLTGKTVPRPVLAAELMAEIEKLYNCLGGDIAPYLNAYRRDCVTLGKRVRIVGAGTEFYAQALDVDAELGLVVKKDDGEIETVRSGEVSVRGMYGYV